MYRCKLAITLFTTDSSLNIRLQNVTPLDSFEHVFLRKETFCPDTLQKSDVVVFDIAQMPCFKAIRTYCKPKTILIFCSERDIVMNMTHDELSVFDDIWIKPFSENFTLFSFQKILRQIKTTKDVWLSNTYLDTMINSIPDLVWFKDMYGSHVKVNNGFCNIVGKTKDDIQGKQHYYIWDLEPEEYAKGEYVCLETEEIVLQERKTCLFDEKVKTKHGMRQFKTYKSPLFDEDGTIMGTIGFAHDVTDLKNMDAELQIILRSMPFAILINDETGSIINVNKKFEESFHTRAQDILGRKYRQLKTEKLDNLNEVGHEGHAEAVLFLDGEMHTLEIHEEQIYDVFHDVVGELCLWRDITVERTFEQKILYIASTDELTGLYNRRFFYSNIEKKRCDNQISIFYIDVDNFKFINDKYGHHAGDEILIAVSNIIHDFFPEELVTRIGGDEFMIALFGSYTQETLEAFADSVLQNMDAYFSGSEKRSGLSVSIGIATTEDTQMDIDTLVMQSDVALYEAKNRGKAQYFFFTPEINCAQVTADTHCSL